MRTALLAVGYTFVLGISLAVAYLTIGGRLALLGPYVLAHSWPLIYPAAALMAALVALPLGFALKGSGRRQLLAVIVGAWIGEYLVLASGIVANEIGPINGIGYWVVATAGPLQPLAAYAGALVGRRLAQRLSLGA